MGAAALVAERAPDEVLVVTGPEPLSYEVVARTMSAARGRTFTHVRITDDEARARLVATGLPEAYAQLLVSLDASIRGGSEDRVTDTVLRITGRAPRSFASFLRAAEPTSGRERRVAR